MHNDSENALLTVEQGKEQYDQSLKQLFSDKNLLAHILKNFVGEFKEYDIDEIVKDSLGDSDVTVSKIGVAKNTTNVVEGISNEDKSNNEGNVTYDIMFKAKLTKNLPKTDQKKKKGKKKVPAIGMYINLEIQGKDDPGYPLESRGVYYAARRLASQMKKIDNKTNYGVLQKVYSIWIVMGKVPNYRAGQGCFMKNN